ncbi:MAG: hypothetical protein ACJA1U_001282 [Bermanella sp.]|jgi:hypothetical protein
MKLANKAKLNPILKGDVTADSLKVRLMKAVK